MDLEHEKRLTAVEERAKSNSHRLDDLEDTTKAINRLATSMEVMTEKQTQMTEKQGQMADNVEKLDVKVTALEGKPAKRWEAIVDKAIWAVLAAVIAFILGRLGL